MNGGAREMRYSAAAIRRDYLRACAGLGMSLLLLLLVDVGSAVFFVFLAFVAIFAAFGAHTYLKEATIITLDESAAVRRLTGPVGSLLRERRIAWSAIDRFKLRYFGRRRDGGRGVVEITLGGGGQRFTADQALEGFDELVRRARLAAKASGLNLDAATEANLSALGFTRN
ncbi:MAG: hypothetical protein WAW96_05530 [Alphaproteobacteria bacterium]